jgi:hypothetical protein
VIVGYLFFGWVMRDTKQEKKPKTGNDEGFRRSHLGELEKGAGKRFPGFRKNKIREGTLS